MPRKKLVPLSTLVLIPVLLIPIATLLIYVFADAEQTARENKDLKVEPFTVDPAFKAYWQAGQAELASYELNQARYGEMHTGNAVLIFVAEEFSTRDLTKSDGNNGPTMPVLALNYEKKFLTGIYPYSILMSTASPLDVNRHPLPLKVATSAQEWCGHTYTQLNHKGSKYAMTLHSYFPGEADQEKELDGILPEDAIWTRIRLAPGKLPVGSFALIPSTVYARLRHKPLDPVTVTASLQNGDSAGVKLYTLDYADGSRQLKIWYEEAFPHGILQWEENYEEGFGPSARHFTTTARRMVVKKLDYWNRHTNADRGLRGEMGL
jgi:hypothetical protein